MTLGRIFKSPLILGAAAAALAGGAMATDESPGPTGGNRLASATSPYLLQHKDNPVDWYPWGEEALAAARAQDKPIFLSIGYSACHWCHVMEHESFEDPATAAVMNKYFISIKVDREERPDLDDIYMTAVQMMTGAGGWPMSVWLTPDLKPFYGGTYFPAQAHYGRPSFGQVLTSLGEAWSRDRASIVAQAEKVHEAVAGYMSGRKAQPPDAPLDAGLIDRAVEELSGRFDSVNGGFGNAPKFPPHRGIALLLAGYRRTGDENLLRMGRLTLDRMARGGMYDQIGGGFHRYSTDAKWLVPHFEKMLYDNALLAEVYVDAWLATGDPFYERVARQVFEWVLTDMTDPQGAFYSTLDADSEGEEGKYYVWRPEEVLEVLGEDLGRLVDDFYDITPRGNFEGGRSIPHVDVPASEFAAARKMPSDRFLVRLDQARARLLERRRTRVPPHLDDKILTAWNGLMIDSLARGGKALEAPRLVEAASRAAAFLLENLRGPDGLMRVSYRKGKLNAEGFLDDQAFFVAGLISLYEATSEPRWLDAARALVDVTDRTFWDTAQHGYFFTRPGMTDLIVRAKNPTDSAIPSGNSIMAASLVRLGRLTGDARYQRRAGEVLSAFSGAMSRMPAAFHNMLAALDSYVEAGGEPSDTPVVAVRVPEAKIRLAPGGTAEVRLEIDIKSGWHINSSHPTLDYLIPTQVRLEPEGHVSLDSSEFPEADLVSLGFAGQAIAVYQGRAPVKLVLRADPSARPGPASVRGVVSFQACNDEACLKPATATFEIPLTLAD